VLGGAMAVPADPAADAVVVLPIPDRGHAPEAPPSGWCGESAIQQALLHFGVWASQRRIHAAGKSAHPDLYSNEIPVALASMEMQFARYAPKKPGFAAYQAWVRGALDQGDPVLAGLKILPTEHPEWGLDHFVVAVGYGEKGLLVNTTWARREWVSDTKTPGLSFANAFYAIHVHGASISKNANHARLDVLEETGASVKLRVTCVRLDANAKVRLERRKRAGDAKPEWSETLAAKGDRIERLLTVDPEEPARFSCIVE
jgi:hypothetical protein